MVAMAARQQHVGIALQAYAAVNLIFEGEQPEDYEPVSAQFRAFFISHAQLLLRNEGILATSFSAAWFVAS